MIDPASVAVLQKHLRRTGRSLLQYVNESFPWVHNISDNQAVARLNQMLWGEQEVAGAITRFLFKSHFNPTHLGAYPEYFTSYNFLGLDRLLTLLAQHYQRDVAELETDLESLPAGTARLLLGQLLTAKKSHLEEFQKLAEQHISASTVR